MTRQFQEDNKKEKFDISPKYKRFLIFFLLSSILILWLSIFFFTTLFTSEGVVNNYFMMFIVLPFLDQALMIAIVILFRRVDCSGSALFVFRIGKKKIKTFLGILFLLIISIIICNIILEFIYKSLNISFSSVLNTSNPKIGISFLVISTLQGILLAPIIEEIFFRGYIQGILHKICKWPTALLGQAILFAFFHIYASFRIVIHAFFLGLILGFWRWRKQTIIPLIAVHMVLNSFAYFVIWYQQLELRKVKKTSDYIASMENHCKPPDYTPEDNALEEYKLALDLLKERPESLSNWGLNLWPATLSSEKKLLLENWILSNQDAIEKFHLGTQKPYYCLEYSKDYKNYNDILEGTSSLYLESSPMVTSVLARAQINAVEGNLNQSVSDILSCYRYSRHFKGAKPLLEQLIGFFFSDRTTMISLKILRETQPNVVWLKELQTGLETISQGDEAYIDFSCEKLLCYEYIQNTFTNDGSGEGHIPYILVEKLIQLSQQNPSGIISNRENIKLNLLHIRRKQTIKLIDRIFLYLEWAKGRTPAELHRVNREINDSIRKIAKNNMYILTLTQGYEEIYHMFYLSKARMEALIVTIAIMRYELEKGDLPDGLDQLVSSGYIEKLPIDPYSNEPFVYKRVEGGFLLYSFGTDFDDDQGSRSIMQDDTVGVEGDEIFWSPKQEQ